jgi:hypothetical protein
MEAIHVQLPDKAVDFIMPKIARQDNLLKFVDIFDDEIESGCRPICDFVELIILNKIVLTLRISKVFAMKPATSVLYGYSSYRDDILISPNLTLYF